MRTSALIAFVFTLAATSPTLAQEPPGVNTEVAVTVGDLLAMQSEIASNRLHGRLVADEEAMTIIRSIRVVLAAKDGRTHINVMLTDDVMKHLQGMAPGEQMRGLAELREAWVKALLAGPDAENHTDAFRHVEHATSDAFTTTRAFVKSRKPEDVVLNFGFEVDGKSYLYASTDAEGTRFSPDAPTVE